jgi:hypothetical protein
VIGFEDGELGVGVHSVPALDRLVLADGGNLVPRARAAGGSQLRLEQEQVVLVHGGPLHHGLVAFDRAAQVAASGLHGREPRLGGEVAGHARERDGIGSAGARDLPCLELEIAEQRLDVGDVLGRAAARRHGPLHGRERAGEISVQLAEVGDARVRGQVRLERHHRVE